MITSGLVVAVMVLIAHKVRRKVVLDGRIGQLAGPATGVAPLRNGQYKPFLKGYNGPACTADALAMHAPGVCGECDWERAAVGCASYRKTGACDAACPHGMCWHADQ